MKKSGESMAEIPPPPQKQKHFAELHKLNILVDFITYNIKLVMQA